MFVECFCFIAKNEKSKLYEDVELRGPGPANIHQVLGRRGVSKFFKIKYMHFEDAGKI